jgi:hypothetical protein
MKTIEQVAAEAIDVSEQMMSCVNVLMILRDRLRGLTAEAADCLIEADKEEAKRNMIRVWRDAAGRMDAVVTLMHARVRPQSTGNTWEDIMSEANILGSELMEAGERVETVRDQLVSLVSRAADAVPSPDDARAKAIAVAVWQTTIEQLDQVLAAVSGTRREKQ